MVIRCIFILVLGTQACRSPLGLFIYRLGKFEKSAKRFRAPLNLHSVQLFKIEINLHYLRTDFRTHLFHFVKSI
ncbi:MAG: hypothetical protein COA69_01655 [Robiginitomaculum sp.]|nr:MAG: hypothetical protein COA69_01655 [Robiginitomaculum sp.]